EPRQRADDEPRLGPVDDGTHHPGQAEEQHAEQVQVGREPHEALLADPQQQSADRGAADQERDLVRELTAWRCAVARHQPHGKDQGSHEWKAEVYAHVSQSTYAGRARRPNENGTPTPLNMTHSATSAASASAINTYA